MVPGHQLALFPDVSGNTVNGVDEAVKRRPTPIFWHCPDQLAHGKLQQWMNMWFLAEPGLAERACAPNK